MIKKYTIILFLITLFSCSDDNTDTTREDFRNAKQLWESQKITNYKINERVICFCPSILQWDLHVKDNKKVDVIYNSEIDSNMTYESIINRANTIDSAFLLIEDILNQNIASFTVKYDKDYGFPTEISVDYNKDIVDEEITYIFSNFKEL